MPILIPVLKFFGIDSVWYGGIFVSSLAVGQATPPVGVNLFTAANLIGSDVDAVAKEAIPYVVMDVIILIVLSLYCRSCPFIFPKGPRSKINPPSTLSFDPLSCVAPTSTYLDMHR